MTDSTPGWQPDPTGKHDHRYWDGSQWTDNVSDAGVASTDPYEAATAPGASDATVADTPVVPAEGAAPPPAPDTTATWPAAPAAPAPPPPYNPAAPPTSGGDGSKRNLLIGGGILAAIVIAVIAFLALGGDDDGDDVRAQLASKLEDVADGELTSAQAECVADLLVDEAGEDAFDDVDFDATETPAVVQNALEAVGQEEMAERCNIDDGSDGNTDSTDSTDDGGDDSTDDGGDEDLEGLRDDCADGDFVACDDLYFAADVGSDLEEFGSTCGGIADPQDGFCTETNGGEDELGSDDGLTDVGQLPDDYVDLLTDTYEDMGLTGDQAECLANKIFDALESGDISEEEAMSEFMDFFSDCDIDPSDISGN
jgi:hypothetical protein